MAMPQIQDHKESIVCLPQSNGARPHPSAPTGFYGAPTINPHILRGNREMLSPLAASPAHRLCCRRAVQPV
jgi:hypothetical protein